MKFTVRWSEAKKFQEGNLDVNFEGVYLIGCRNTSTDKRFPIYVGQGNIGDRLRFHFNNNQCIRNQVLQDGRAGYYRYAKCEHDSDRLDIEFGLYRKYGGSEKLCNEVEPPGSGLYRTIEVVEEFP